VLSRSVGGGWIQSQESDGNFDAIPMDPFTENRMRLMLSMHDSYAASDKDVHGRVALFGEDSSLVVEDVTVKVHHPNIGAFNAPNGNERWSEFETPLAWVNAHQDLRMVLASQRMYKIERNIALWISSTEDRQDFRRMQWQIKKEAGFIVALLFKSTPECQNGKRLPRLLAAENVAKLNICEFLGYAPLIDAVSGGDPVPTWLNNIQLKTTQQKIDMLSMNGVDAAVLAANQGGWTYSSGDDESGGEF
jgi:hypothetical protein